MGRQFDRYLLSFSGFGRSIITPSFWVTDKFPVSNEKFRELTTKVLICLQKTLKKPPVKPLDPGLASVLHFLIYSVASFKVKRPSRLAACFSVSLGILSVDFPRNSSIV